MPGEASTRIHRLNVQKKGGIILSKRLNVITGNDFIRMVEKGAGQLHANVDKVNALNVFPVPDGDTGTNMNLTLASGVEELRRRSSAHIGKSAEALAKGLLMGARGNSGVILSQLFRGFAKAVAESEAVDSVKLAAAFQSGVDMAYKAVVKPVEGTILTVAKAAAQHAILQAERVTDIVVLMKEIRDKANEALSRTPEQLPVLKQVGVVDAGGQGLLIIYDGFVHALEQADRVEAESILLDQSAKSPPEKATSGAYHAAAMKQAAGDYEPGRAQAKLATEDIEFGYCTEFMVTLNEQKLKGQAFQESAFRERLSALGDSLLVVNDDDLVKVHIHAEYPGSVMNLAMEFGELSRIKIENMRDQHTHILLMEADEMKQRSSGSQTARASTEPTRQNPQPGKRGLKPYGFAAVSAGTGISDIFTSIGVNQIISGGQSMNPSTEDIVQAVQRIEGHTVFVLPNNSNIILAAQQAAELIKDKKVVVIPTKTIPQGIAAVLAYQEQAELEHNVNLMQQAALQVQTGTLTVAVRDTSMDDVQIRQGDYIGIHNSKIVSADADLLVSCQQLLDDLITDSTELVTIYTGEDALEDQTEQLVSYVEQNYEDLEVEIHKGGQPLYYYIISAE
jgi:DAK2 domain fusion protein YloV